MDHQIEIITTISEHERSSVFLAMDNSGNSGGVGKPVILKRISGCTLVPLFQRIQEIDSSYFPKIIEIKTENGKTEVLEEYIEGRELSRILSESSLTEAEAFSYMKQLLEAVRILHEMNPPLLHRDIKPENILITEGGQVRLLDFDAAREWNNDDRQSDTVLLGTRGYAAPEQFGYSQTDVRSDLYSVGIVCRQICEKIVLSGQKKQKLKSFCDRATMFDPEERFQSAKEMLEALKRIENGDGGNTVRRRHIKPVFAVIPFLIIAGILLAILIFHDKSESAYDLAVIPGDYIFRRIETRMTVMNEIEGFSTERYPGLLMQDKDGNYSTTYGVPELRYIKSDPQAVLFHDYLLEGRSSVSVSMDRYSEDGSVITDSLKLRNNTDYSLNNGFICITVEALGRLQNGLYDLNIEIPGVAAWLYRLEICEKTDMKESLDPCTLGPVQYYSLSIENDVFFNIYNATSSISRIECNGKEISKNLYRLSNDGKGAALGKAFFEADTAGVSSERLELRFEMKDGKTASGVVVIIQ